MSGILVYKLYSLGVCIHMKALQFSTSSTDKTILVEFLIQNRRLTITTTINDKLATIKIVKNWKVCLTRSPVWLAGAILQMFWSVKQHYKNVKCVETTLTKLCNQSNHSMKSHVIKIPICHSHWSSEPLSTSGINLIKILLQTQSVILPVLVSICLIYVAIG